MFLFIFLDTIKKQHNLGQLLFMVLVWGRNEINPLTAYWVVHWEFHSFSKFWHFSLFYKIKRLRCTAPIYGFALWKKLNDSITYWDVTYWDMARIKPINCPISPKSYPIILYSATIRFSRKSRNNLTSHSHGWLKIKSFILKTQHWDVKWNLQHYQITLCKANS